MSPRYGSDWSSGQTYCFCAVTSFSQVADQETGFVVRLLSTNIRAVVTKAVQKACLDRLRTIKAMKMKKSSITMTQ